MQIKPTHSGRKSVKIENTHDKDSGVSRMKQKQQTQVVVDVLFEHWKGHRVVLEIKYLILISSFNHHMFP